MNCYDCVLSDRTTPAVAVCARCGAALCREHIRTSHLPVKETTGLGPSEHEKEARRLTCSICYGAEHSA